MPRNLLVYGAAVIGGLIVYAILRAILGPEIMFVVALIGVAVGGVIVYRNLKTNRRLLRRRPNSAPKRSPSRRSQARRRSTSFATSSSAAPSASTC